MKLAGVVLVVVLVGVNAAACGDDDTCARPGDSGCSPTPGASPGDDDRNEADETYVQISSEAIGSLRQMAELAEESSDSTELTILAEEIADELGAVTDRLATWEEEWDLPEIVYDSTATFRRVSLTVLDVPRQEPDPDRVRLDELDGPDFDALWVELVTETLESVVSSAETVVDRGSNADLRELAEDLAEDGTDWIDEVANLRV